MWPFQNIRNFLHIPSCQRSFWITLFFSDALALIRTSKSEYGSATELCNFLDRLMASLTRSRNSLVNPKKKTLDELRNSRQVVWFFSLFFCQKNYRTILQGVSICIWTILWGCLEVTGWLKIIFFNSSKKIMQIPLKVNKVYFLWHQARPHNDFLIFFFKK